MIAVHLQPAVQRTLSVLLDLGPDGAEYAEALRRLRAWADRGEVERLLDGLAEGEGRP